MNIHEVCMSSRVGHPCFQANLCTDVPYISFVLKEYSHMKRNNVISLNETLIVGHLFKKNRTLIKVL